ncbi:TPA: hypothetical protein ACRZ2J_004902 [Vibrio campbellii]
MKVNLNVLIATLFLFSSTLFGSELNWRLVESKDPIYYGKVLSFQADYKGRYSNNLVELEFNCTYKNLYQNKQILKLGTVLSQYAYSNDLSYRITGSEIKGYDNIKAALKADYIATYFNNKLEQKLDISSVRPYLKKYASKIRDCEQSYDTSYQEEQKRIANERLQREILNKKENQKRLIIWGSLILGGLVALFFFYHLLKLFYRKLKQRKLTLGVSLSNLRKQHNHNAFKKKVVDAAIDESVRETVRRESHRLQLSPNEVKTCNNCLGEGCGNCNNRGWQLKD